jgi:hypothetical protein
VLRALQKYAVRCGGRVNHRIGLGDAALIKDNHVAAAGGVTAAFRAVLAAAPGMVVEIERDTLEQVGEALAAGAALILPDNASVDQMRSAVAMARAHPAAKLAASGGLRLENARKGGQHRRALPVRRRPHPLQSRPRPRPRRGLTGVPWAPAAWSWWCSASCFRFSNCRRAMITSPTDNPGGSPAAGSHHELDQQERRVRLLGQQDVGHEGAPDGARQLPAGIDRHDPAHPPAPGSGREPISGSRLGKAHCVYRTSVQLRCADVRSVRTGTRSTGKAQGRPGRLPPVRIKSIIRNEPGCFWSAKVLAVPRP